jgi:methyltransferase OMS1
MTDKNKEMLIIAENHYKLTDKYKLTKNIKFELNDNNQLSYESESFDTVIDTFGLCSVKNPVSALQEMKRVLKSNGKILLLEHGRSNWSFLNEALDKTALDHSKTWGCWWNRNIEDLITQSGLKVDSINRSYFGTFTVCVCTKN